MLTADFFRTTRICRSTRRRYTAAPPLHVRRACPMKKVQGQGTGTGCGSCITRRFSCPVVSCPVTPIRVASVSTMSGERHAGSVRFSCLSTETQFYAEAHGEALAGRTKQYHARTFHAAVPTISCLDAGYLPENLVYRGFPSCRLEGSLKRPLLMALPAFLRARSPFTSDLHLFAYAAYLGS